MGWVRRGRCRFYCRSVRRGRRVLHEYYGTGASAELVATLDRQRRLRRQAEQEGRRQAREIWEAASRPLLELIAITDLLARAALLAAGFWEHHSEWRKRRA